MKNILLICLFGTLLFSFGACKKCGTCTTTTTTTVSVPVAGYPQTSTTTTDACGDNYKDLRDMGTTTSSSTVQGITATSTAVTKCVDD